MKASTRFKFRYRDGTANKDGKIRGPRKAAVFLRNPRFTRYNEKGLVDKDTGRILREWEIRGETLRGE
jgi:hypothetical protein